MPLISFLKILDNPQPANLRRGIIGVIAGDYTGKISVIPDIFGQRADLVQAGGKGNQPVKRKPGVGRLKPHHPAKRSRLAN